MGDSGKHNYHNQETGETTSEKPADLLPDNGSESSAGSDSDLEKRKKRENESGAKAHESPREFSDEEFAYEGDAVAEDAGETPWEKPAELSDRESESSDGHDTPWEEHWEEHFHEDSGKHYYHNQETGETTWEKTAELLTDKGSDEESQREFGDEDLSYEGDAMAEN